jgi:hypothetical protein
LITLAVGACVGGCGSDDGDGDGAPGAPGTTAPSVVAGATVAPPDPGAEATEEALAVELQDLAGIVLTAEELPPGFTVRSSQPITQGEVAAAQVAIVRLAQYIASSDLEGAWGALYTRDDPPSGISSIVYRFASAGGAARFVETTASLTTEDYVGAISVERVQAEDIGDGAQMMRYRLPGARVLEYNWSQGALAGQVILRYSGDREEPDDPGLLVSLARLQAQRMAGTAAPP